MHFDNWHNIAFLIAKLSSNRHSWFVEHCTQALKYLFSMRKGSRN